MRTLGGVEGPIPLRTGPRQRRHAGIAAGRTLLRLAREVPVPSLVSLSGFRLPRRDCFEVYQRVCTDGSASPHPAAPPYTIFGAAAEWVARTGGNPCPDRGNIFPTERTANRLRDYFGTHGAIPVRMVLVRSKSPEKAACKTEAFPLGKLRRSGRRGVAQSGSAPALGASGLSNTSYCSDDTFFVSGATASGLFRDAASMAARMSSVCTWAYFAVVFRSTWPSCF